MKDLSRTESTSELDTISLVGDMVTFRGRACALKTEFSLSNGGKEGVFVTELHMEFIQTPESPCFPKSLLINQVIAPGCSTPIKSFIRVSSDTPPGNYTGELLIGEKRYKIEFEVYSEISLSVSPTMVQYQGVKPGETYNAVVMVRNNGNMAYVIQQQNHSMMLDYDYLCKAASMTISEKEPLGFFGFLNGVVDHVQAKYAKPVKLSVRQSGKEVQPGEEIRLDVSFTLPKDVEQTSSYSGNFRIAGSAILSYQFFA